MTNWTDRLYAPLRALTVEERLEVAAWFYEHHTEAKEFARGLKYAAILVNSNGWRQIAPNWVKEWRKQRKKSKKLIAQ